MKLDRTQIKSEILAFLKKEHPNAFRPKEIAHQFGIQNNRDFKQFMGVIETLLRKGEIAPTQGQKIVFVPETLAEGVFSMHPNSFGFVRIEGMEEDIFIPPDQTDYAMDGDTVRLKLAPPSRHKTKRQEGKIIAIVARKRKTVVGTIFASGNRLFLRPDDNKLTEDFVIHEANGAKVGQSVLIELGNLDKTQQLISGNVVSIIGEASDPKTQILALAMSRDIRPNFPEIVEAESAKIPLEIPQSEIAKRLDLRQKRVFTIDPHDAKDFDDAIHIELLANGNYEVGVHIADVSHYIPVGGALDNEAYLRATSVYLVDRVIPMLPEKLSNGVCSLRPHEDKLTYSVIFEMTPAGKTVSYKIAETVIHSHQRFAYEEAQALLDDETATHDFANDVRMAWKLSETLRRSRFQNGSVRFDNPEVKVRLNEASEPIEIYIKHTKEANWLIEELMLLANRTVAKHIYGGKKPPVPFVYRTHASPNEMQMRQLADFVKMFNLDMPIEGGIVSAKDLNALLEAIKGKSYQPIIEDAALRAMSKAKYTVENIGHYGLAFADYSHFTSPIRRYPDLIVHRLLKKYALNSQKVEVSALTTQLMEQCLHCSSKEKEAEEAERDSIKLKQVEYMTRHIGENFDGVVSGVTNFGIFVSLKSVLVEGMIPLREMNDDFYEYDESLFMLVGKRSKKMIRIGDEVNVKVVDADVVKRRLDLIFVKEK